MQTSVPNALLIFLQNIKICYHKNMNNEKIYTIEEIKKIIDNSKGYIQEKYFVDQFFLFGSYAKNQQTSNSDIDLLVSFKQPIDMFDFMDLEEYLEKIFNKKIDLGTLNSLKKFIKDKILKEAIIL